VADHPLLAPLLAGDRRALSRAITLVESTRDDHRTAARQLLEAALPHTGGALRLGLSGAPGAGKSTLIEAVGLHAIEQGRRCAVLAIDPSSSISGGSILGDKTRMSDLGRHPDAYIRPTPSSGTLGGVARRTREALLLCEAAGFDLVVVETVGVGQSEVAVGDLVDLFVLITAPGGGDELQGIKRGIMELADLIAVNKADGDLAAAADRAASDLRKAVHLLRPKRPDWTVEVVRCSALHGQGIAELWAQVVALHARLQDRGLRELRQRQDVAWMWSEVTETLLEQLRAHPGVRAEVAALEAAVADGTMAATAAAHQLLAAFSRPAAG
jgi:LAO/AO transport system kinase